MKHSPLSEVFNLSTPFTVSLALHVPGVCIAIHEIIRELICEVLHLQMLRAEAVFPSLIARSKEKRGLRSL